MFKTTWSMTIFIDTFSTNTMHGVSLAKKIVNRDSRMLVMLTETFGSHWILATALYDCNIFAYVHITLAEAELKLLNFFGLIFKQCNAKQFYELADKWLRRNYLKACRLQTLLNGTPPLGNIHQFPIQRLKLSILSNKV